MSRKFFAPNCHDNGNQRFQNLKDSKTTILPIVISTVPGEKINDDRSIMLRKKRKNLQQRG